MDEVHFLVPKIGTKWFIPCFLLFPYVLTLYNYKKVVPMGNQYTIHRLLVQNAYKLSQ